MGIEENKALVRHICTLFTKGELETAFNLFSAGYTEHSGLREIRKKKFMQSTTLFFDSFRDVHINIEEIVAEGDRVAVRETWTAVHTGQYVYIETVDDSSEFYDLINDPFEMENAINDPQYQSIIAELQSFMQTESEPRLPPPEN